MTESKVARSVGFDDEAIHGSCANTNEIIHIDSDSFEDVQKNEECLPVVTGSPENPKWNSISRNGIKIRNGTRFSFRYIKMSRFTLSCLPCPVVSKSSTVQAESIV